MDRLLRFFLNQFVQRGSITFVTASGMTFTCGDGTGEPVRVRLTTKEVARQLLLDPEMSLGEAYTDGTMIVERGSIADLLAIILDRVFRSSEAGDGA